jgi:N-acetyl-anhydromuramyl-L-alanine amidase AmpD
MKKYNIPRENVLGHREAQAIGGLPVEQRKTCPGKNFNMDAFRGAL